MPFGARQQSLNQAASVPGLLTFNSPKSRKKNFSPRVGLAYAPNFTSGMLGRVFGSGGKSSIRAGFTMAYDVIFDNIFILSSPPQFQQTKDFNPVPPVPGYTRNPPADTKPNQCATEGHQHAWWFSADVPDCAVADSD